ncbi:fidgetin-like protein 2 [Tachyglossus aculeatus]|uniref:fidgetin-like protein 2 n=1 Tax=Tachyglossus aculeatus TaxID=9261 RepID=UPI0018F4C378|nr:fidgetin-like protein 2 [Tachyglossus aculeatus]
MHWTPEHAQPLSQWPEQHLDVSSTTSPSSGPPKAGPGPAGRPRCHYAWANDDISALTASALLKRYADKYAAALDSPYERAPACPFPDGHFGPLPGPKGEPEPWGSGAGGPGPGAGPDPPYPLTPIHDGLLGAKASGPPPGLGGSPALPGGLAEPLYPGVPCGGSQDFGAYGAAYLPAGYCAQAAPPPSGLAPGGLLPNAAHGSPALVPGYGPPSPLYSYPAAGGFPAQPAFGGLHAPPPPPPPPPPPAPYPASGLATPTPVPAHPTTAPAPRPPAGYPFQPPGPAGTALKRKAFAVAPGAGGDASAGLGRYRKGGYETPDRPPPVTPYPPPTPDGERRGNGYPGALDTKRPDPADRGRATRKVGAALGLEALGSPPFAPGEAPALEDFREEEAPVSAQMSEGGPPVLWADVAGQAALKALLEEELVWPALRTPAPSAPRPRTLLLFGPHGAGKTLLARCLATQLGSPLLRLSGAALAAQGPGEAGRLLRAAFLAAAARRPPAVLLLGELEALLPARPGDHDGGSGGGGTGPGGPPGGGGALRAQLLELLERPAEGVLVVGTTARPGELDRAAPRRFARRFYVALPDGPARRQILARALAGAGRSLAERELAALARTTEGFSGGELVRLCQQAAAVGAGVAPGSRGLQPPSFEDFEAALCKVRPGASQKDVDLYVEWDKVYGSGP